MDISILIVTYNHERFIAQALESILVQETQYDYEVIIGEDCSTDSTREIIKQYEHRFQGRLKPVYREKNVGAVRNFLDCLQRCKGRYIAYLEADDAWLAKEKLQRQVSFLEKHPDFSAVVHNWQIEDAHGKVLRTGLDIDSAQEFSWENLNNFQLPAQTSTLVFCNCWSKERIQKIIQKIGMGLVWIPGDRLIAITLLTQGKIMVLPEIMSLYRFYIEEGGNNWSSQYEVKAKKNYLYFFLMEAQIERITRKMGHKINLIDQRLTEFYHARAEEERSTSKWKFRVQWMLMILLEVHKITFMKKAIAHRKMLRV